jgi:hypothetical protein
VSREAQNVIEFASDFLERLANRPDVQLPAESDPVDANELAAAARMLFPGRRAQRVRPRQRLRPVSYEADVVDAVWTPEVHWRWQSPAFHAAVRALLLSHLRLRKTPLAEGTATNLGCLPQDVMPLIVSQLGEVWVEPLPLVLLSRCCGASVVPNVILDGGVGEYS